MKHKRSIITWGYPLFVGVIAFNILRVTTDLTAHNTFWQGDKKYHIFGLVFSVLFCYIMDAIWRYQLNNPPKDRTLVKEYVFIFVELSLLSTLYFALGVWAGVFFAVSLLNCFLIFLSYIPILMLFYTLIRSDDLNKKYQEKTLQLEKMKVDQYQAELKFLKSQYHPHFLFNALNTIYFQIDEQNKEAKRSVELLSDLLRYQLYDIEQEVTMEQEINYLRKYIAFQQLRMSERLVLELYFDPKLKKQKIHPLLFQPLIENAFKYVRGDYCIQLDMRLSGTQIQSEIKNSIAQPQSANNQKDKRIGIENLKRRLTLLYPNKHNIEIKQTENMFVVKLTISID